MCKGCVWLAEHPLQVKEHLLLLARMRMWWLEPSRYIGSWGDHLTWRRTEWQVWSVPNPACVGSQVLTLGNSPAVQWLRLWASTAGGLGSITGHGTDLICLRAKTKTENRKQKQYCNKFKKDLKWSTSIILKKKKKTYCVHLFLTLHSLMTCW